jgi:exodeoxyribonuclease VII large subunit
MVRLLECHHLRHALLAPRLQQAVRQAQGRERQRIDVLAARLRALDPRQVLGRGYAWLTDAAGRPLSSVTQLHAGQLLTATLADGQALTEVRAIAPAVPRPESGSDGALATLRPAG